MMCILGVCAMVCTKGKWGDCEDDGEKREVMYIL